MEYKQSGSITQAKFIAVYNRASVVNSYKKIRLTWFEGQFPQHCPSTWNTLCPWCSQSSPTSQDTSGCQMDSLSSPLGMRRNHVNSCNGKERVMGRGLSQFFLSLKHRTNTYIPKLCSLQKAHAFLVNQMLLYLTNQMCPLEFSFTRVLYCLKFSLMSFSLPFLQNRQILINLWGKIASFVKMNSSCIFTNKPEKDVWVPQFLHGFRPNSELLSLSLVDWLKLQSRVFPGHPQEHPSSECHIYLTNLDWVDVQTEFDLSCTMFWRRLTLLVVDQQLFNDLHLIFCCHWLAGGIWLGMDPFLAGGIRREW